MIGTEHLPIGLIGRTGLINLMYMTGIEGTAPKVGAITIMDKVQVRIIPQRGKGVTVIETGVRKTDVQQYMRI